MSNSVDNEATTILELSPATLRDTASPGFGVTAAGFSAKPFARVLAEKLMLARTLLGDRVELGSGSPIRKLIEVTALEDARMWAELAATYDDMHVASARGLALSRLGEELGLPRPHQCATGYILLKLQDDLPAPTTSLTIPRGARLLTSGGHHVALSESVVLSKTSKQRRVAVEAFYPGPAHNLAPSVAVGTDFPQKIDRWHRADARLAELNDAEQRAHKVLVGIDHTESLSGGEQSWPDLRYRQLLLRAPRSIWTLAAVEMAVAMVPGVRQVLIQDRLGGLDLQQSIFGNFNFIQRMFSAERDLGSPYYFSVLVAPTAAAIWGGTDGLRAAIEQALEDVRPIGIYPTLREAKEIGVGVAARLVVKGLPLPTGPAATVNGSAAAEELRKRLHVRLQRYIDGLQFGEPVRVSEIIWALMSEPGIADARDVRLVRFPAEPEFALSGGSYGATNAPTLQELPIGSNLELLADQVPVYVELETPPRLEIV
jgi:hypothetical protein